VRPLRRRGWPILLASLLLGSDWPQFRGPNASGVAEDAGLPLRFGPEAGVVWKTPLPPGWSSPVVAGGRVYVTGLEGETLFTIALDRETGAELWRRPAPRPRRDQRHDENHAAAASPASDGARVFVFFADFGLLAYGAGGEELWRLPLGPFNNPFGHGSSPILAGDLVLQVCDQDAGSFVVAVDRDTGTVRWRRPRPFAQRGYSTPVLWRSPEGELQALVAGSYRLDAYAVSSGEHRWWVGGLPWQIKPTPVLAGDVAFLVTSAGESSPGEQQELPAFERALELLDRDGDGRLAKHELEIERDVRRFEEYLDLDDSGWLEERDWEQLRLRRMGMSSVWAFRLGGEGDMTQRNRLWNNPRSLPNVPSPLHYRGVLYTLKEGGVLTSLDPGTGEILKQGRLSEALGSYYASPVAADGHLYTVSEEGRVSVIRAGADWEVLAVNALDAGSRSTPAIAAGQLFVRTYQALYCFGRAEDTERAGS
jgi:outer membrane protein assembly factor BamB